MDVTGLRSLPLFRSLDDEGLERWAERMTEETYLAGSGIIREEDFAYRFFVVLDGEVDVLHGFDRVARLGPRECFGEVGVVTGGRRTARVVAHSRCRLASMLLWDYRSLAERYPSVGSEVERLVAARSGRADGAPVAADPPA